MASVEEIKAALGAMKGHMQELSMHIGALVENAEQAIGMEAAVFVGSTRDEPGQLLALLGEFKQHLEDAHGVGERYEQLCDEFSAAL